MGMDFWTQGKPLLALPVPNNHQQKNHIQLAPAVKSTTNKIIVGEEEKKMNFRNISKNQQYQTKSKGEFAQMMKWHHSIGSLIFCEEKKEKNQLGQLFCGRLAKCIYSALVRN